MRWVSRLGIDRALLQYNIHCFPCVSMCKVQAECILLSSI